MYIKLFGERNSGTMFLFRLLQKNITNTKPLSNYYKGGTGWKHGKPNLKLLKKYDKNNLLLVCIVRELKSWLNSMHHRPYHIKKIKNFNKFITRSTINIDKRKDHDTRVYAHEKNQNLFQLRYSKYLEYNKLFEGYNVVLVNLTYLQKNYETFLNKICQEFSLKRRPKLVTIDHHTKTKNKTQNDRYKKHSISTETAARHIKQAIEGEINRLTFKIGHV